MLSINKNIIIIFVVICVLVGALLFVFMDSPTLEMESKDLFRINECEHMGVTVVYQTEEPVIRFISPNGDKYDEKAIEQGKMKVEKYNDDKTVVYKIPNAMPGQWKIEYNKGTNDKLSISYVPYVETIAIRDFEYIVNNNQLRLSFFTEYYDKLQADYKVYLITDNGDLNTNGTLIAEGKFTTNLKTFIITNIDKVNVGKKYKIKLIVADESLMPSVFITEDSFLYSNSQQP